ncbi:MAG TPA: nucleotide sugar dehydrogenase [Methylophilus sp.]|nr:nucleotide sugar dehydrogenase [Methylophilus sp.]HQQ33861.1 nucleotide sugar dehydrogenase [Methylophilus sp.]
MLDISNVKIAIVGLGYVGLPLAVEFGKKYPTVGFDINPTRVDELCKNHDRTEELSASEIASASQLSLSSDVSDIKDCNVFIVTVPTPVDEANMPDLVPLIKASEAIASILKPHDVVIYESTVYPGTTEEVCVPILEKHSGLTFNQDFYCGYSPERINPGDKLRKLKDILKVTSGSTPDAADFIDGLYQEIIQAGTHKASSIKVAEAAKVIENTQRDVNIALINELAMIFNAIGIDTTEVLAAAGTKWNFLPFKPGLVGGHCIGVDPYYLTHKATVLGYHPELILAARRINSRMGLHVAHQLVRLMARKRIHILDSKILVLGLTFKENCTDLRNTRVIDIIKELEQSGASVDVYDPWVDQDEAFREFGLRPVGTIMPAKYDALVLAVAHEQFLTLSPQQLRSYCKDNAVIYDVKSALDYDLVDGRL